MSAYCPKEWSIGNHIAVNGVIRKIVDYYFISADGCHNSDEIVWILDNGDNLRFTKKFYEENSLNSKRINYDEEVKMGKIKIGDTL